jgi:hypothetical protein
MSEPIYRTDEGSSWKIWIALGHWRGLFDKLVNVGYLVPVERCEHDKYDGHYVGVGLGFFGNWSTWCDGMRIGADDDD